MVACGARSLEDLTPPQSIDASVSENACRGKGPVARLGDTSGSPGDPCGPCLDGVLICQSPTLLACEFASRLPCPTHDASPPPAHEDAGADVLTDAVPVDVAPSKEGDAAITDSSQSDAPAETGNYNPYGVSPIYVWPDAGTAVVHTLSFATKDLVLDPVRHVLYVTALPSEGGPSNSVMTIDPSTAAITGSLFVGDKPHALAITDDAHTLYVGIDTAGAVAPVDLTSGTVGTAFPLGPDRDGHPSIAVEIRVVPGSSTQYVVSRGDTSYHFAGLQLYDGATSLSEWGIPYQSGYANLIAFADKGTLYGLGSGDLYQFTVSPVSGIQISAHTIGRLGGEELLYQGGWLFGGLQALNAASMTPVGIYPGVSYAIWPDGNETEVWSIGQVGLQDSEMTLFDFDRTTFVLRGSAPLPTTPPEANLVTSLVHWSPSGFAFRAPSAVYIVELPQ